MKVVAIIQARMGSTRLPGKVLEDLAGWPMLARVVSRARNAQMVDLVAVATSTARDDDAVAAWCAAGVVACVRGSEDDVLDRYRQAACALDADAVVRLTADCPLLDPAVIDRVVQAFLEAGCDYASNTLRPTYPDGLDVEVFSRAALESAWRQATKPAEREHVTPFLRLDGQFRRLGVENAEDLSRLRWTVDEPADLEFVRDVYHRLAAKSDFGLGDVLALLAGRPGLAAANSDVLMNEGYYRSLYAQAPARAAPPLTLDQSRAWLARAERVIPGTAQTFSKGRSQYVQGVAPVFLQRGEGCRVWDVDGNGYIDYVQGLLPNILGYAHAGVNAAAARQYAQGHSFSLPHPLEVELAERLTRLIPCAEMVRFAKNGSDATAAAVRGARALTGRERVACCGYHGWQDWYIGSTTRARGVPEAVRALTHPFPYNDPAALAALLDAHAGEFAAVIMEPVNFSEPNPGYLQAVQALTRRHGALLIFDEICSGFHLGLGGAQKRWGVTPDMACFGKAMANGYPLSCLVGRADVMAIYEEVFFSSTFGGEVASMAAAMQVLDVLEGTDALVRMESQGRRLQDGFNAFARSAGMHPRLECVGFPTWSLLKFRGADGTDGLLERSLFAQEAVKRGLLLLVTHNLTAAHDDASTEQTLEAYAAVFKTLAHWLPDPSPERFLEGPAIQPVFKVR